MTRTSLILLGAAAITAMFGCNGPNAAPTPPESRTGPPACDAAAARSVAVQFGQRLKNVPLLAADDRLVPVLQKEYGPYITRPLLEAWTRDPHTAPGREVSSPWPDRIEVAGVTPAANGACAVEGAVVYQTSVEATAGGEAARAPITLTVQYDDGWRIAAVKLNPASSDVAAAVGVVRRYYEAIAAGDYRRAYESWGSDGAASGQSFDQFAAGFAHTAHVEIAAGEPGRVEGAAGSRYIDIPVVVRATTDDGEQQRFEGHYTLRRVVVDGATPAQRRWHISAAQLVRVAVPRP